MRGYDYAQAGAYFVTICAQDRACLFGDVTNDQVRLQPSGEMVLHWWMELPNKYPDVEIDDIVVMPNHLHGIILINDQSNNPQAPHAQVTLGAIIGWFKTMTTNAYIRGVVESGWRPFDRRLWQANYFEHII